MRQSVLASLARMLHCDAQGLAVKAQFSTRCAQLSTHAMEQQISDSGLIRTDAYINGYWVQASDARTFAVSIPASCAMLHCKSCCRPAVRRR